MHVRLVKGANGEYVRFFQSSAPYLNNSAVSVYSRGKTSHWKLEDPHPSSHRLLSLSNGHYGIYFTILNHELKREDHAPREQTAPVIVMFVPKASRQFFPEFFISKANQDFNKCISELKTVLRDLLSTWSLVRPRGLFRLGSRSFSTSAQISEELTEEEEREVPFLVSFQKSQLDKIVAVFSAHLCPADLDVIYPLYQGLKRNEITLPSVHEYNIVLQSICMRQLDSQKSLSALESKLTCLLTVYQDFLAVCARDPAFKPNTDTFNIVLSALFKGALDAISIGSSPKIPTDEYHKALVQSNQFCQVGAELYLSIKEYRELDSDTILPNMVSALSALPNFVTKPVAERLISLKNMKVKDARFFSGLISLSKNLKALGMLLDSKQTYHFVSGVFESYKDACVSFPQLKMLEFDVYSSLIQALISNGNLPMATRFLDQILLDYKTQTGGDQSRLPAHKSKVSQLISTYLDAIMASGKPEDLHRAYNLLHTFKLIPYIPEVSIDVFNTMINGFINRYSVLEVEKSTAQEKDSISKEQLVLYKKIWELYEYAAIRKDFLAEILALSQSHDQGKVNCRDFLLSLSLDLNDHTKISRLLKEVLLKDHVVSNWNVSKKLCLYLYNGVVAYDNTYYCNLLWSFVEQQGSHYSQSSTEINKFLSEHIAFLLTENGSNLDLLLNSTLVSGAFTRFSLETDNMYGLMSICLYFMASEKRVSFRPDQAFKVLQFKSCLVNQLEDPANHYIEFSPDLVQFKKQLYASFRALFNEASLESVTTDIIDAAAALNIESSFEFDPLEIGNKAAQLDLSAYFNISYANGLEKFLEAFKSGYSFNHLTWSIVINRNTVMDILEKGTIINVADFAHRIIDLKLDQNTTINLLCSLIELQNDKVNIELFKFFKANASQLLTNDHILNQFADYLISTSNMYVLDLFLANFYDLASQNGNRVWIGKFMLKLVSTGRSTEVCNFLVLDFEKNVLNLDLKDRSNERFLHVALTAFTNEKKDVEISQIFRHYFSGIEGNKRLLNSEPLLLCLIDYYVMNGSYKTVVEKFEVLQDRSLKLRQSIQFARFMAKLNGNDVSSKEIIQSKEDIRIIALALLQKNQPGEMRQIFEESKLPFKKSEQLFDCLVKYLTKATHLSGASRAGELMNKFESVLKFCKEIRMNHLSYDNLVTIIRFLAAVKADTLLNVIVNKVINDNQLVTSFNFYFLQFSIPTGSLRFQLLNEFKKALTEVGDNVNLDMVAQCEQTMV